MKQVTFFVSVLMFAGISCVHSRASNPLSGASQGYPSGYQQWHSLGGPIKRGMEFRRLYANDIAFQRTGKEFPVGTVLVKEELSVVSKNGGDMPGPAFRVSVMRKVGQATSPQGGWSFEAFDPGTKKKISADKLDTSGCYLCHIQKSANDMVYSHIPPGPANKFQ